MIWAVGVVMLAVILGSAGCTAGAQAQGAVVLKVEPAYWWVGHSVNPVRLLVRGRNLQDARVRPTRPGVDVLDARPTKTGTYLFVSVMINSAATPGDYPLVVEAPAGSTTIPFNIIPALDPATNFQGITVDDVIYLIMVDRFADGDVANNAPSGAPREANSRSDPRAFHGGDFRGIIDRLPYLKELGVTALWLTPWYDNSNDVIRCVQLLCPSTSYHGYHAIDYYAVEDHFGDLKTLRELVQRAHDLGLKVIQDQVANHVGPRHPWVTEPPLDTWFNGTKTSHAIIQHDLAVLLSPHASNAARRLTVDGWFPDDPEDLPDLNQDEPEVARYEIQNALWWVGVTGIDGIRQDTLPYMPRAFVRDLSAALHRQYPKIWIVGEVARREPSQTAFFLGGRRGWDQIDTGVDSVFDFPLFHTSREVFTGQGPACALRDVLRQDWLYPDPARLTTVVGNHDEPRFLSLPGATLDGARLHVALTLTTRGVPQLYYGDEVAMEGAGDPDNRRDFPGGFPGDKPSAFEPSARSQKQQLMYDWTRQWLVLRREHPALRFGRTIELSCDDDIYVYARQTDDETVVVGINRAAPKRVSFSACDIGNGEGTQLLPLLPGGDDSSTVVAGTVTVRLPGRSAIAYRIQGTDASRRQDRRDACPK